MSDDIAKLVAELRNAAFDASKRNSVLEHRAAAALEALDKRVREAEARAEQAERGRDEVFAASAFAWHDIKAVRGTSVVNPSVMLLDEHGKCLGIVHVLQCGNETVRMDVERALGSASNPAKMRRFMNAARNGEAEANARADKAEAQLDAALAEVARLREALERIADMTPEVAAIATEEAKSRDYDFIYNQDDWEYTHRRSDAYMLVDDLPNNDGVHEFSTLIDGPAQFAAFIPTTIDEDGNIDDGEWKWFSSRAAAEQALKDAAISDEPSEVTIRRDREG